MLLRFKIGAPKTGLVQKWGQSEISHFLHNSEKLWDGLVKFLSRGFKLSLSHNLYTFGAKPLREVGDLTLRYPGFFYTFGCPTWGGGVKLPPGVSRVLWHLGKKFQRLYQCFQGQAFQWCKQLCRRKSVCNRKRYGGQQTGNNYISGYRTARQIISTCFSTFSTVRYTMAQ